MKKRKEWWESAFDAHYLLEYKPLFTPEGDRREVARLVDVLGLPMVARILDVPCGQGRHTHLLAEAGYDVDGLDYSRDLLEVARKRGTGPNLRYTQGDMRALPSRWSGRFDAVLNLFTSFGFFAHPADDVRVIREFARVLKPGGRLFVSTVAPEHEIYQRAEVVGPHLFRIRDYDFRSGETMFFVDHEKHLAFYLGMQFAQVEVGRVTERLMTRTLEFYVAVATKAS